MKILIIRFSSFGDVVLSTPVPRLLKNKYPESVIHFITKKEYSSIYNNNNYVDKVIKFEKNLYQTYIKLRNEKYNLIIDLHNNLRSNYLKLLLFKRSYTYDKQFFKRWLVTNFKLNLKIKHIASSYIETLRGLNIDDDRMGLDFYIDENNKIFKKDLPISHRNGFYSFVMGAKHFTKRLPVKKIIELCDKINKPIILIGGKDEISNSLKVENFFKSRNTDYGDIARTLDKKTIIYNLCGKLSINQSASIIQASKAVYTNDTGFMHVAAAFKKRVIAIFGSTHPNLGFYPYKTNFFIYQNNKLSCRPCTKIGLSRCPLKHFKCMNEIKFEDVIL